jgi:hypothetical protein
MAVLSGWWFGGEKAPGHIEDHHHKEGILTYTKCIYICVYIYMNYKYNLYYNYIIYVYVYVYVYIYYISICI